MIPSRFEYVAAKSVQEAVALLGRHGSDAKLLAGGHSLIPLMKLRLASPAVVIDLSRIPELRFIREEGDDLVIGGMTTYHALESSALIGEKAPLLAEVAGHIGDAQVRNRGTIGGSLVHADPAADMPAAALALDARMKVVGPSGEREIPAASFFVDMLQTAVGPNEVLAEVRVAKAARATGSAYRKVAQAASGFALVGVAAVVTLDRGRCSNLRIAVTGIATKPYRASGVETALQGRGLEADAVAAACASIADGVDALSDIHASGEYRKSLAAVYARRAIEAASAHAGA
jgi:carbon-monoxide dehydrogenase medium subunit